MEFSAAVDAAQATGLRGFAGRLMGREAEKSMKDLLERKGAREETPARVNRSETIALDTRQPTHK